MHKSPNTLTYSSQGVGSSAHLCSVILNDMSRSQAQHIGYKETTMAVTDVVGRRVSFSCQTSTGVLPLVQSGKLRALAVTGSKRWDAMPNIPTVSEAGVSGFEVSSQLDFMAPSGTPQPIIGMLSQHIAQIAQTPEFKQFCAPLPMILRLSRAPRASDSRCGFARRPDGARRFDGRLRVRRSTPPIRNSSLPTGRWSGRMSRAISNRKGARAPRPAEFRGKACPARAGRALPCP